MLSNFLSLCEWTDKLYAHITCYFALQEEEEEEKEEEEKEKQNKKP